VEFLLSQGIGPQDKLLALAPGAAHTTKRWPEENLAALLGRLARPGRRFLFVGDARDAEAAARILVLAGEAGRGAVIAAGRTDFPRLAALLHRCQGLVTNDSGPMHVAAALGVPLVALFGPTVREFGFFPRGPRSRVMEAALACRPCSVHGAELCPLGHHDCMRKLTPPDVAAVLEEAIQG
jgi:heptosyltransferase-2